MAKKSKEKQGELPGMPAGANRDLLLECAEVSESIREGKQTEHELLDRIRTLMRDEKQKVMKVESPEGKEYVFKLKTTGERVTIAAMKQKKELF